jgi:hypothetical protein
MVMFLIVQIKGSNTQFLNPLCLPSGQKSAAYQFTLTKIDGE